MGKLLWSELDDDDELFEGNRPGCMGGILDVLHYHHWQRNARKVQQPQKMLSGRRYAKDVYDDYEVHKHLDPEIDPSAEKPSLTSKRSLKARLKALISDNKSKEESYRQRGKGFPAGSRLHRTYSIHHLEPTDNARRSHPFILFQSNAASKTSTARLDDQGHVNNTKKPLARDGKFKVSITKNPLDCLKDKNLAENHTGSPEKFEKENETSGNHQKHFGDNQHSGNASQFQRKEYPDVLEIFGVNKGLFSKTLEETDDDSISNCFDKLQTSDRRSRLTKSGSFPAAASRSKSFRPSKIKHKHNEIWSFPKGEKLYAGTQATKYAAGEHKDKSSSCHEIDGSVYDLSKDAPTYLRRTSSVNESLQRYAQLFQNNFSRDAKLHHSKSLKLTSEYEIPSMGHASITFKRVRSLLRVDSYCSLQNEQSCDGHFAGIPSRTDVDSSKDVERDGHAEPNPVDLPVIAEKQVPLVASKETECLGNTVESESSPNREHPTENVKEHAMAEMYRGHCDKVDEQTVKESNLDKEDDSTLVENSSNKLPQPSPVSVSQNCYQEDVTSPAGFPIPDGLKSGNNYVNEEVSPFDSQCKSCSDTVSRCCNITNGQNFKAADKRVKNQRHVDLCTTESDTDDFNYVTIILELSGFNKHGFLAPWQSHDQPLNPLIFEEVEACWPHEPQYPGEEIYACCHHRLLFDTINEVIAQIYDSSFTYYPKALSFSCRIPPMPVNYRVLEEVWARISKTRSSRPDVDQLAESVVDQDLGKDDGWMKLQLETECVTLELEDMIFGELLESVLCF